MVTYLWLSSWCGATSASIALGAARLLRVWYHLSVW